MAFSRVFCDIDHVEKSSLVLVECPAVRICPFPVVRVKKATWGRAAPHVVLRRPCWRWGWASVPGQAAFGGLRLGCMFQVPTRLLCSKGTSLWLRAFGAVVWDHVSCSPAVFLGNLTPTDSLFLNYSIGSKLYPNIWRGKVSYTLGAREMTRGKKRKTHVLFIKNKRNLLCVYLEF